jgi:uncharacterized protein YegP (UPF0339 family)
MLRVKRDLVSAAVQDIEGIDWALRLLLEDRLRHVRCGGCRRWRNDSSMVDQLLVLRIRAMDWRDTSRSGDHMKLEFYTSQVVTRRRWKRTAKTEYRWRVVARNGEIIAASSEGFADRGNAEANYELVRDWFTNDGGRL